MALNVVFLCLVNMSNWHKNYNILCRGSNYSLRIEEKTSLFTVVHLVDSPPAHCRLGIYATVRIAIRFDITFFCIKFRFDEPFSRYLHEANFICNKQNVLFCFVFSFRHISFAFCGRKKTLQCEWRVHILCSRNTESRLRFNSAISERERWWVMNRKKNNERGMYPKLNHRWSAHSLHWVHLCDHFASSLNVIWRFVRWF